MQAERTAPQRKFVLSKVGPGDYLLLSNDGTTLWRFRTYEDGPSTGIMDWPRDLTFWSIWRYVRRISTQHPGVVDTEDWDQWEHVDSSYKSRREAIDAALRMAPR